MNTPSQDLSGQPSQRESPLPLDANYPNTIRFSGLRKMRERLLAILSGLTISGGGILATSSIPYTLVNISNLDEKGNAMTLLTHMGGLEKTDKHDGGRYLGDPDTGSVIGSEVTRDGKVIDGTIDKFLGLPGNFSILIGGLLIVGFGFGIGSEVVNKTLKERMRDALSKGEKITFIKGTETLTIQLHISSSGLQQISLTGTYIGERYISYNNANAQAIIEKIIHRNGQGHALKDIVPNS